MTHASLQNHLPELDPAVLQKLSAADCLRLQDLLTRELQARALHHEAAIEAAVSQVPALLRSTLRRMLST